MQSSLEFVGIGEALIDLFENGEASLGGAPLNVAVHAHHLLEPLKLGSGIVVSAVGADKWGGQARSVLLENVMSTEFISTGAHPTGTASVFVRNGEPGFEIAQNVAWDYISSSPASNALADRCAAVCFGSLAQRSERSRETIRMFLGRAHRAWCLYDVNFRRSTLSGIRGYSREIVESSCRLASAIKANENEIVELAQMFGISSADRRDPSVTLAQMEFFLKEFNLEAVIVTRAERGAFLATQTEQIEMPPAAAVPGEVHPVGAGDAFSAGVLFGRALGWPWRTTMELASKMGSWVTRHISAIPPLSPEILEFASAQLQTHPFQTTPHPADPPHARRKEPA